MRSLRSQLSLAIMLTILFIVATISILSNVIINRKFEQYISEQQKQKVSDIVSNFNGQHNDLSGEWNIEFIHGLGMYALHDGYIIKVYDRAGEVVWDAENHDMSMCTQMMQEITERMEKRNPGSSGEFVLQWYELTQEGQKVGSISIKYYGPYFLSEHDVLFLDTLNLVFLFIGILSLAASFVVGYVLAQRIARPIAKTAYIAKQISNGNYSIRFEGKTKTRELDDLVIAVNQLAGVLSEQEKLRKQLTTDIAHELRTPITTLGSHLEALMEGIWEPTQDRLYGCYEEIGRLTGLVSDLEKLNYIENDNLNLHKTPLNLIDIVRTVGGNFEIEMSKKNLMFTIEGEMVCVFADRDRMIQVVTNLISNAVKYTHENGTIKIEVKEAGGNGILTVEDDGIGIPEHELPFIFERFYRTDKSRNRKTGGAGIGLAIVKSIVAAHGGTVTAESTAEQGSCFVIVLPKFKVKGVVG